MARAERASIRERASLFLSLMLLASCARDRSAESPVDPAPSSVAPPQQVQPRQPPIQQAPIQQPPPRVYPGFQFNPRPPASATAVPPAPIATALSPAETADLYRAQDACLSNCDQFACMRIAGAYRDGAGVPRDPLAGRRYAIHACLECGAAGVATVDQCPSFGIDVGAKKR